jgi:hypothetical protein
MNLPHLFAIAWLVFMICPIVATVVYVALGGRRPAIDVFLFSLAVTALLKLVEILHRRAKRGTL